jgi:hypothetical protein
VSEYSIVIEFGVPVKLIGQTGFIRARPIFNGLFDAFPVLNGLGQGDA